MKIHLICADPRNDAPSEQPAQHPYEGAKFVEVGKCPACGCQPGRIQGKNRRVLAGTNDTLVAEAYCMACRNMVGLIQTQVSTIFGIEEDLRMVEDGRWRVY